MTYKFRNNITQPLWSNKNRYHAPLGFFLTALKHAISACAYQGVGATGRNWNKSKRESRNKEMQPPGHHSTGLNQNMSPDSELRWTHGE